MADSVLEVGVKINNTQLKKDIKELEKELAGAQKEIEKLNEKESQIKEKFAPKKEQAAEMMAYAKSTKFGDKATAEHYAKQYADEENEALSGVIAKREELNQKVEEYNTKLAEANAKLQQQSAIAQADKELNSAVKSAGALDKIKTEEQYQSMLARTKAQMERISAEAEKVATKHGLSKDQLLSVNSEYQRLSDLLTQLDSKQGQFKNKTEKTMKTAKKSTSAFGAAIKGGIKQIAKMGLAMLGIRSAFNAFRKAANSYMESNEKLKSQMESLWNIAGQAIGPVIEWLIKGISTLVVWVDSLVQSLSGISLIAKANAAALKKQASAGKAASASLAGFDEMNKLSDSSGGGGTSGLFDTSMAGDIPKFLEDIKNKILAGDWYGAGETAGEALMDGIESVDWHSVGSTIGDILGGAVSFALGFSLNLDPLTILSAATDLVSGFTDSVSETIQSLDWADIGADLIDLLVKSLIFGAILTDPAATLIALIFTPEGQKLTSSASELIGSIIGALLSAIIGAGKRIGELALEMWNSLKGYFDEYVDWEGTPGEIIEGLFNGIVDALKDVGTWIKENIWEPFKEGFKEAFDIHSPSKKMEDFGVNIIEGLCQGITDSIDKVKEACKEIWEAIKEKFSDVGGWFKEKFTDAWEKVKEVFTDGEGGTIFSGIKEGISETFKGIVNKLIDGINKIIRVPFNKINSTLNTIRGIEVLGVSPFKNLWGYNPLSIPEIPKLALGGIVNRPGRGVPAIIGEAGAEAVLPLENNTEWMDILADKIGGNVTIPIYMDGKKIATYVVDIQKKKAFALNGA